MSDHNKISPAIFFSLAPSTSSPFDQSKKKHTNTKNSCQNNCFSQSSSKSKLFSGNGRTTSSTLHTLQFCCGNAKILESKSKLFHSNLQIYKKNQLQNWQNGRLEGILVQGAWIQSIVRKILNPFCTKYVIRIVYSLLFALKLLSMDKNYSVPCLMNVTRLRKS